MSAPRIAPGGRRELGVPLWAFASLAGRVTGTEPPNLFTTLGRHRGLFRGWLWFAGRLMPGGKLPRRETELVMERPGAPARHVTARIAPLGSRLVLALVEDRTRERRVEAVRRDFVANVSHELKTPVGAIRVLADAVADAADDPEAVRRFAGRMLTESDRLTQLVQQIIELSRLQGDDPLEAPVAVDVDGVIAWVAELPDPLPRIARTCIVGRGCKDQRTVEGR